MSTWSRMKTDSVLLSSSTTVVLIFKYRQPETIMMHERENYIIAMNMRTRYLILPLFYFSSLIFYYNAKTIRIFSSKTLIIEIFNIIIIVIL